MRGQHFGVYSRLDCFCPTLRHFKTGIQTVKETYHVLKEDLLGFRNILGRAKHRQNLTRRTRDTRCIASQLFGTRLSTQGTELGYQQRAQFIGIRCLRRAPTSRPFGGSEGYNRNFDSFLDTSFNNDRLSPLSQPLGLGDQRLLPFPPGA